MLKIFKWWSLAGIVAILALSAEVAFAHGVAERNQGFLGTATGVQLIPYMYLGAKHMVTGYDHLLYLAGVIFFLTRFRDIVGFVSLFAIGHSIILLFGVLSEIHVNAYLIDAIIGLSVAYKALENLRIINFLNPKVAVFGFGLIHGFGLSTKLQDIALSPDGLVTNMIAFNVGVEIGQVIGLVVLFALLSWLRGLSGFSKISTNANVLLFGAGIVLFGLHAAGYFLS